MRAKPAPLVVRRIKFAIASACPWQDEFALAHARLRHAAAGHEPDTAQTTYRPSSLSPLGSRITRAQAMPSPTVPASPPCSQRYRINLGGSMQLKREKCGLTSEHSVHRPHDFGWFDRHRQEFTNPHREVLRRWGSHK